MGLSFQVQSPLPSRVTVDTVMLAGVVGANVAASGAAAFFALSRVFFAGDVSVEKPVYEFGVNAAIGTYAVFFQVDFFCAGSKRYAAGFCNIRK